MREAVIGAVFICCLAIGSGLGYLFGNMEVGGTVGLAVGLVGVLLFRNRRSNRKYSYRANTKEDKNSDAS